MNYLKTYQIFEAENVIDPIVIITKLNRYKKVKYTLNKDNSIDVEGNVVISFLKLTEIPVKFGKVTGNFKCSYNQLTTLEHCPTTVTGYFYCSNNKLTSLKGCPVVTGDFSCSNNFLTSLENAPITINGGFNCSNNLLTSLEHAPITVSEWFNFANNKFPEDIQKSIKNFKGTWQELLFLINIWQSKKLTDLDNKTGLFN
jgi:hypothetical protein